RFRAKRRVQVYIILACTRYVYIISSRTRVPYGRCRPPRGELSSTCHSYERAGARNGKWAWGLGKRVRSTPLSAEEGRSSLLCLAQAPGPKPHALVCESA